MVSIKNHKPYAGEFIILKNYPVNQSRILHGVFGSVFLTAFLPHSTASVDLSPALPYLGCQDWYEPLRVENISVVDGFQQYDQRVDRQPE